MPTIATSSRPRRNIGALVGAALAVGIVAAGGGAATVWIKHDADVRHLKKVAAAHPPHTPPAITPTSAPKLPSGISSAPPGWKVAAFPKNNYAYNVPSEWTVLPAGQALTFNTQWNDPKLIIPPMLGQVAVRQNPGSQHCSSAFIGATATTGKEAPADAAKEKVTQWAWDLESDAKGTHPKVDLAKPRYTTMGANAAVDQMATVTTTAPLTDKDCGNTPVGSKMIFHAYAVDGVKNCLVFIVEADQSTQSPVADETLEQIIGSVRGVH